MLVTPIPVDWLTVYDEKVKGFKGPGKESSEKQNFLFPLQTRSQVRITGEVKHMTFLSCTAEFSHPVSYGNTNPRFRLFSLSLSRLSWNSCYRSWLIWKCTTASFFLCRVCVMRLFVLCLPSIHHWLVSVWVIRLFDVLCHSHNGLHDSSVDSFLERKRERQNHSVIWTSRDEIVYRSVKKDSDVKD